MKAKLASNVTLAAVAITALITLSNAAEAQDTPRGLPVNPSVKTPVVNINTATEAQLAYLPGIGPKLATAIYTFAESGGKGADRSCDHRCHFKSVNDLLKVKGIGPKKAAALAPFVVVKGETTAKGKIK